MVLVQLRDICMVLTSDCCTFQGKRYSREIGYTFLTQNKESQSLRVNLSALHVRSAWDKRLNYWRSTHQHGLSFLSDSEKSWHSNPDYLKKDLGQLYELAKDGDRDTIALHGCPELKVLFIQQGIEKVVDLKLFRCPTFQRKHVSAWSPAACGYHGPLSVTVCPIVRAWGYGRWIENKLAENPFRFIVCAPSNLI